MEEVLLHEGVEGQVEEQCVAREGPSGDADALEGLLPLRLVELLLPGLQLMDEPMRLDEGLRRTPEGDPVEERVPDLGSLLREGLGAGLRGSAALRGAVVNRRLELRQEGLRWP